MNFNNKTALVTGGSGGIGRATSLAFARHGARVVVVDRDTEGGAETVRLIEQEGGTACFVEADVSKSADVRGYVKAALDAYGTIDCFFNNAGIEGKIALTADYEEDVFDAVIAVNLKGVFLGLKYVIPEMLINGGSIVNTASTAGIAGSPGLCGYAASKHGVIGMTRTAASEYGPYQVRVNAICPGPTETRMIHSLEQQRLAASNQDTPPSYQSFIPIGRFATPEEVADFVLFLSSDRAGSISGGQYPIDGARGASMGGVVPKRPL